jgi:hypothetical protein
MTASISAASDRKLFCAFSNFAIGISQFQFDDYLKCKNNATNVYEFIVALPSPQMAFIKIMNFIISIFEWKASDGGNCKEHLNECHISGSLCMNTEREKH